MNLKVANLELFQLKPFVLHEQYEVNAIDDDGDVANGSDDDGDLVSNVELEAVIDMSDEGNEHELAMQIYSFFTSIYTFEQ